MAFTNILKKLSLRSVAKYVFLFAIAAKGGGGSHHQNSFDFKCSQLM